MNAEKEKIELREMDKRESLKVVSDNSLITAQGLADLSINARKLLYLTIAQCRKKDTDFYGYKITPTELAELFGITRQRVYEKADEITDELMDIQIRVGQQGKRKYTKYHLCALCRYDDDAILEIKLDKEMAELLLGIDSSFSQPRLWDFLRMRSTYSMAIWHLMQREMQSKIPGITHKAIEFDLTLDELREATGTENKFKQISEFKRYVLDKAIREIRDNLLADITYTNLKRSRKIVGFRCTAVNVFDHIDPQSLSRKERMKMRYVQLHSMEIRKQQMSADEKRELEGLVYALDKYED